ncbi:hypothetical protein FRC01_004331 [Tulasnella sp. 417]|nr:hypothetical protein FRC01_004331 [Tulasnella sp. 417]
MLIKIRETEDIEQAQLVGSEEVHETLAIIWDEEKSEAALRPQPNGEATKWDTVLDSNVLGTPASHSSERCTEDLTPFSQNLVMETGSSGCDVPSSGGKGRDLQYPSHCPPLLHLPTELLAEIFRSTLPSIDLMSDQVEARLHSYMQKLYGMRLVAKRWQGIIDGTPTFWTFVLSILPPHVNEATMLRSGNGLLAIVYALDAYTKGQPSAKDFFKSWAHTFPRWSAYRGPLLSQYLDKPAPRLEKVILRGSELGDEPLELLGGNTLSLRHVDLSNVSIRWRTGLFTNLKVLKLVQVGHSTQELTTTLLLDILLASPFLEQLALVGVDATTDTSSSYPIIPLPRLKFIRLSGCTYTFTGGILRQIRASSCTTFWLTAGVDELDLPRLLGDDLRHFNELFRSIHKLNGSSEITLDLDGFEWTCSGGPRSEDNPSFIVVIFLDPATTCFHWVGRILQNDPGLTIRFSFGATVSQDVFESMASMRCVTRVEIEPLWTEDQILSVFRFLGDPLSASPSLPSLPCLQEILFDGTFWNVQKVLDMLHSRFNSLSREHVERTPLRIRVKPRGSRPIIDLTTLIKIREMDRVESVQFLGPENVDGWLAITWDEEASKPAWG